MEKTIKLKYGYKDGKGVEHFDVTIGKRTKVKTFFLLDADPQSQIPSQYEQLIRRHMITKFGTLPCPVPLQVLLKLDTFDADLIAAAADEFLQSTRPEIKNADQDGRGSDEVRLLFPIAIGEVGYDIVRFGKRLTVADNVEADKQQLAGCSRLCFQLGRQIVQLRDSESGLTHDGGLALENFREMDSEDLNTLRMAGELFRLGLLEGGETADGHDANDISNDAGNGDERSGSDEAAGGTV